MLKDGLVEKDNGHAYKLTERARTSALSSKEALPTTSHKDGNISLSEVPDCPKCRSNVHMREKEWRHNRWSTKRVYRCEIHGIKRSRRSESTKIPAESLQELEHLMLEHGLDRVGAQEQLRKQKVVVDAQTITNALRKKTQQYADTIQKRSAEVDALLGIQVGNKRYRYLLVDSTETSKRGYLDACMDETHGIVVVHQNTRTKSATEKVALLRRLKDKGYEPDVIVLDEEGAWIEAASTVYPKAIQVYCGFHLKKRLNKALPTRGRGAKGISCETRRLWRFVKYTIYALVDSADITLAMLLGDVLLKSRPYWGRDERAKTAVENFLEKMDMYLNYLKFPHAPGTTGRLERIFKTLKENAAVLKARGYKSRADVIDLLIFKYTLWKLNKARLM
jgi:transposase-like protein